MRKILIGKWTEQIGVIGEKFFRQKIGIKNFNQKMDKIIGVVSDEILNRKMGEKNW